MSQYLRVEKRLIHGQVLIKWMKYYKISEVIVIDDETAEDPVMQTIYKASFLNDTDVRFLSVGDMNIEKQENHVEKSNNKIYLVKDIESLGKINLEYEKIGEITFSRMPYESGKKKLTEGFFVSDIERRILKMLKKKGVILQLQAVPSECGERLNDYL